MNVVDVVGEGVEGGGNLQLLIRTTCHSDSCRFIIIFTYSNFKSWAALQHATSCFTLHAVFSSLQQFRELFSFTKQLLYYFFFIRMYDV